MSDTIQLIISRRCTYANDIMINASMKKFIEGMSCSEISSDLNNGISERHVRNLSNMALDIFAKIHEGSSSILRNSMHSYILQIEGTTDSEFSMIVAVSDVASRFTLHARKCNSESNESIRNILQSLKKRFSTLLGITCYMRAGYIIDYNGSVS